MKHMTSSILFANANWVIMMGVLAALLAAQWKDGVPPVAALLMILVLIVLNARLIILDFIDLRGKRPYLAIALFAWPLVFTAATLIKALALGQA